MKVLLRIVFCALPALLVHSRNLQASHESGYLPLTSTQAARYVQCQPEAFEHWYQVAKGQDLQRVLAEILENLPVKTAPRPLPADIISSGDGLLLSPFAIINPDREKRQTESQPNEPERISLLRKKGRWPPPQRPPHRSKRSAATVEPQHKILLLLPGFEQPYSISGEILLEPGISLGICTQPPATITDKRAIPWKEQAIITVSDSGFSGPHEAALSVNDSARLTLNSVRIDAHNWSSSFSVILIKDRGKADISNSTVIRLANREDDWGRRDYDMRSLIQLYWWDYAYPGLTVTNSRLYQGMRYGVIVTAHYGGNIIIKNTEHIIANAGIAWNVCNSDLDIIGGSISSCNTPITISDYANLETLPSGASEFCPTQTDYTYTWGYLGIDNLLNFEQILFKDSWYKVLSFCDDYLKVEGQQNTGNRAENLNAKTFCIGHLAEDAQGAVEIIGQASCPPGHSLANSQIPSPTIPASVTKPTTPSMVSGKDQTGFNTPDSSSSSSRTKIPGSFILFTLIAAKLLN